MADDAKPSEAKSKPPKVKSGRVTPKGTPSTGRYTPPTPDLYRPSPIWVPVLMFVLLGLGTVTILANYVNLLPGDDPSNTYLLVGLGLITAGFITATRYR